MPFKISLIETNGRRLQTRLISSATALISSAADADLQVEFPPSASLQIEQDKGLQLTAVNCQVNVQSETLQQADLRRGARFSCHGLHFYATIIQDEKTPGRRTSLLGASASLAIWVLLIIHLVIPVWLPYRITSHEVGGRSSLMENCSHELDVLRSEINEYKDEYAGISQMHSDIMANLQQEVEQIAWVFRNGGDSMSREQLQTLKNDISRYRDILPKIGSTDAVQVKPLKPSTVLKALELDSP